MQQKKKKPPLQLLCSVYIDQSPPVRWDSLHRQLVSAVLRIYKYTLYLKRELKLDSDARFCVYPPGRSELSQRVTLPGPLVPGNWGSTCHWAAPCRRRASSWASQGLKDIRLLFLYLNDMNVNGTAQGHFGACWLFISSCDFLLWTETPCSNLDWIEKENAKCFGDNAK